MRQERTRDAAGEICMPIEEIDVDNVEGLVQSLSEIMKSSRVEPPVSSSCRRKPRSWKSARSHRQANKDHQRCDKCVVQH